MRYEQFLENFSRFAAKRSIEWAIVGSCAMLAHGLDIGRQPGDLDLEISKLNVSLIAEILEWAPGNIYNTFINRDSKLYSVGLYLPAAVEIYCHYANFKGVPRYNYVTILGGTYPVAKLEECYWFKRYMCRFNDKHDRDMEMMLRCADKSGLMLL